MSSEENLVVDEQRAAALVGLSITELRQLARLNEMGRACTGSEGADSSRPRSPLLFTYAELARLGFLAARSSD
jgi:hypothetical protein